MRRSNYSLRGLEDRVQCAKASYADYIERRLAQGIDRAAARARNQTPVIAFCGMGRAGKDTGAEYLAAVAGITYSSSSSRTVLPIIASLLGISQEKAWEERHAHREFWIAACHLICGEDYTLLIRMHLGVADVCVGIRGKEELKKALDDKLVDLAIWIENNRVERDVIVEYTADDCDLVITNNGTFAEYFEKLLKFTLILKRTNFQKVL